MNEILWLSNGNTLELNNSQSQDIMKIVDFVREYVFKKQQADSK